MKDLKSNVKDVALIFEGGGMRNSYSAGILNVLLEKEIYIDYVSGISAGASHAANYLIRDRERIKRNFVDVVRDENFGGMKSFLKGNGYFNSDYLYTDYEPDKHGLYLYDRFFRNEAKITIGAFDAETGSMKYFTKSDMTDVERIKKIVRASCSLPLIMKETEIDGRIYFDGGVGRGILIRRAIDDGYKKFFVVLTRPKGYRKVPPKSSLIYRSALKEYPLVVDGLMTRYKRYNEDLDLLEKLKDEGKAYIVYAKNQSVENTETNLHKLQNNYEEGYFQGLREYKEYLDFLGLPQRKWKSFNFHDIILNRKFKEWLNE